MSNTIYSSESRTTINWASGTSTEIFIYPSDGNFVDRNFTFRISTATVEAEESTFTFFEGITRHLMILKGELELIHEDRYIKQLKPFDQDTFSGEWPTRAKGKVTDFNLMLKNGAEGSLTHIETVQDQILVAEKASDYLFVFVASGSFTADEFTPSIGDLIQVEETLELSSKEPGNLIVIEVNR